MPELNFRVKIIGGAKTETRIEIIPQSISEDRTIRLANQITISEPGIAAFLKNKLTDLLILRKD